MYQLGRLKASIGEDCDARSEHEDNMSVNENEHDDSAGKHAMPAPPMSRVASTLARLQEECSQVQREHEAFVDALVQQRVRERLGKNSGMLQTQPKACMHACMMACLFLRRSLTCQCCCQAFASCSLSTSAFFSFFFFFFKTIIADGLQGQARLRAVYKHAQQMPPRAGTPVHPGASTKVVVVVVRGMSHACTASDAQFATCSGGASWRSVILVDVAGARDDDDGRRSDCHGPQGGAAAARGGNPARPGPLCIPHRQDGSRAQVAHVPACAAVLAARLIIFF
jgi:hypothetical protein